MAAEPVWRIGRAPAKVNLGLRVVGRRNDGYHLLDSLVAFADYGDHVAVAEGPSTTEIIGPFATTLSDASPEHNLARRAVDLHRARFGGPEISVKLRKRLPVAAGIGGGSADGAAVLRLLGGPRQTLAELALELGADGPMCLAGVSSRASGVGEALSPAPTMPPLPMVLINPGVPLSTPAVFKARLGDFSEPATLPERLENIPAVADAIRLFGNDLTAAAAQLAPEVSVVLNALEGALVAGMSGSGATCFGLYPDKASARAAARSLRRPGWWVRAVTLNRAPDCA